MAIDNTLPLTFVDYPRVVYIYGLRASNSSDYFYIGSTYKFPTQRLKEHIFQVKNNRHSNKHFQNRVNRLGIDNIDCDILEMVGMRDRWKIERDWINKLSSSGHKLVNRIHNGIEYKVVNGRLTREKYNEMQSFIDSPLFDNASLLHNAIKSGLRYLQGSGDLLEGYFGGD